MTDTITTELRAAMNVDREYTMGGDLVARVYCMGRDEFADLCDAIDAAHANLEAENESLRRELDRVLGEQEGRYREGYREGIMDGCAYYDAEHTECLLSEPHGWVELPKDADGEYIRAGDKLDGYGKTIEVVEIRYGRSGWVLVSREGNAYADTSAFAHHKPPTVEDVLEEMYDALDDARIPNGSEKRTYKEIIAEYAAKLRLAKEGE